MAENVLRMENVTMQFGGVVAVNNLSLEVNQGEIVALIGPNGAGKTTAFNCVTGVYEPTNGRIQFQGETIVENYPQGKMERQYAGENKGLYTQRIAPTPDRITQLEIARALATEPKLLLLDEPAAGMNPQETQELTDFIKQIRTEYNLSVFMIEHHMDLVMQISDRIYVLDFGRLISQGTPEAVQNDPRVVEAYLGVTEDAED